MNVEGERDERRGISFLWYVAAFLVPVIGLIAGIVFLARGKVGPGLALWGTAVAGAFVGVLLLGAMTPAEGAGI